MISWGFFSRPTLLRSYTCAIVLAGNVQMKNTANKNFTEKCNFHKIKMFCMIFWIFPLFSVISNGIGLSRNILVPWYDLNFFLLRYFNSIYPETKQNKSLFAGKTACNLGTEADGIFPFFHHLPNWIPGKLLQSHFLCHKHRNPCVTHTKKMPRT